MVKIEQLGFASRGWTEEAQERIDSLTLLVEIAEQRATTAEETLAAARQLNDGWDWSAL